MSPLFGKKDPLEQARIEQARQAAAALHDPMVQAALEQFATWAFPGSQVVNAGTGLWKLVHTSASGAEVVDITVTLEFKKERPVAFSTEHYANGRGRISGTLTFDRESLDEALRRCLSSGR